MFVYIEVQPVLTTAALYDHEPVAGISGEPEGERGDGNSSHASADKDLSLPLGIPGRRRPRFDGLAWHVVGSGAGEGAREGGFPFLSWAKL